MPVAPGIGAQQSYDLLDEHALAGAGAAHDEMDGALVHTQGHATEHRLARKTLVHIDKPNHNASSTA